MVLSILFHSLPPLFHNAHNGSCDNYHNDCANHGSYHQDDNWREAISYRLANTKCESPAE